jgi:hypothetical protein
MSKISAIITFLFAFSLSPTFVLGAAVPAEFDSTGNEPRALSQNPPPTVEIFVGCTSTKLASPIRQIKDTSQQKLIADTIMQAFNEVYPTIPLASVKYFSQPVYNLEGCMGFDDCTQLPPALAPSATPPLGSTKIVGRWPVGIDLGAYPATAKGSWAYGDDFDALDIAVGARLTAVGLTASNCRVVEFVKGVISSTPTAPVAPPMALKTPTVAPVIALPKPNIVEIFVWCKSTKLASPIRQVKDGSQQKLIAATVMQAFNEVYPAIPLASVKYIPQPVYNLEGCIDFDDCPGLPPALAPSATPPLGSTKIVGRWPTGTDLGTYPATAKGSWAYGDDFDALDIAVGAKLTAAGLTASNCRVDEFVKGVISSTPTAPVAPPMALKSPTAAPVTVIPNPKIVEIYVTCRGTDFILTSSQSKLAGKVLEMAYNSVYAATQPPMSNVSFGSRLASTISWGSPGSVRSSNAASAVFRGFQQVNSATGLYETPAIKQLYPAFGASFAANLKASGHRKLKGVTKCSVELMAFGAK